MTRGIVRRLENLLAEVKLWAIRLMELAEDKVYILEAREEDMTFHIKSATPSNSFSFDDNCLEPSFHREIIGDSKRQSSGSPRFSC